MRQLLAGIKQNNLSRIFCYILWTFSSYSGKVSITFSSSPVRWATFFLIILIICCCFAGEAILTWSLSNDIDGLPTSLINPFWHLLEQTVILLWSGTHHHQLEKKNWISICRCQTISKPASVTSTINLCALLKEKDSFPRTTLWWFGFVF